MESAKECVTTHLPNELALKMDGAQAYYLYPTIEVITLLQCVGGCNGSLEALAVMLSGTAISADLGVSSKYSKENFED